MLEQNTITTRSAAVAEAPVEATIKDHLARLFTRVGVPNLWTDPLFIEGKGLQLLAQAARVIHQCYEQNSASPYLAARDQGGPLRLILEDITRNHRPAQEVIDRRRQTDRGLEQLFQLEGERAGDIPELRDNARQSYSADQGLGDYEEPGEHTCKYVNKMQSELYSDGAEDTRVRSLTGDAWADCEACYHKRVRRIVNQAHWEARETLVFISDPLPAGEAKRQKAAWRQQKRRELARLKSAHAAGELDEFEYQQARERAGIRHVALPLKDGRIVLVHIDARRKEKPFPNEKRDAFDLVEPYANTPDGQRVGGTGDWGGPWQGMRGDGRKRHRAQKKARAGAGGGQNADADGPELVATLGAIIRGATLLELADMFNVEVEGARKDTIRIDQLGAPEIYAALVKAGYQPRIDGGKAALDRYIQAREEVMSRISPNERQGGSYSDLYVTHGPPGSNPPAVYLPGMGDIQ